MTNTKESHYEISIYWSEEDELYIAEVPELPGCMADGREIPVPKGKLVYA